jgi:predicted RNase H-like nuclease (RuvC/YqgF family)
LASDETGKRQNHKAEEQRSQRPVLPGLRLTFCYEAVNAMLLNEFLKEHRKVEDQARKMQEHEASITQLKSTAAKQEATIAQQQNEIKSLTANLKEQAAQIQAVNERLEAVTPLEVVDSK